MPVAPRAPSVEVFIASFNTRDATELAVRSLLASDSSHFGLVVGDGGSTDGTLEMLEELGREVGDRFRLDLTGVGWRHHQWIEHQIRTSTADYVVFSDSDMFYRRRNVVRDLVKTAQETSSAMVTAELCPSGPGIEPVTGEPVEMAARPGVWLFLVAPAEVRGIESSFSFHLERSGDERLPIAYDTGALWFAELRELGLRWASLPGAFTRRYRHYAGLTWRPMLEVEDEERVTRVHAEIGRRLSRLRNQAGRRR